MVLWMILPGRLPVVFVVLYGLNVWTDVNQIWYVNVFWSRDVFPFHFFHQQFGTSRKKHKIAFSKLSPKILIKFCSNVISWVPNKTYWSYIFQKYPFVSYRYLTGMWLLYEKEISKNRLCHRDSTNTTLFRPMHIWCFLYWQVMYRVGTWTEIGFYAIVAS